VTGDERALRDIRRHDDGGIVLFSDDIELFYRLGVAIAIGVIVGVERHWRERDEPGGSRTAGIRTFSLIGMLGGAVGLLEGAVADHGGPTGLVTVGAFIAFAIVFAWFKARESEVDRDFSVTTVIAALLTFLLGTMAVMGEMQVAAAGGVALVAILASREMLHRFLKTLTWPELRSAIVLLGMTFVILPLVPDEPIGPYGGISPAKTWTLVVLLAAISFVGYVAVKALGASRGEVVAGAIGGIVSSTALTVSNARKSLAGNEIRPLAAGAAAAGAVSYLRTAALAAGLAPAIMTSMVPPLVAGAAVFIAAAFLLARGQGGTAEPPPGENPFDLMSVLKLTLLLVVVAFLSRAASAVFGAGGLFIVSGLSGLADVDAVTVTVGGLLKQGLAADTGFLALSAGVIANTVAKAVYAAVLGKSGFAWWLGLASALAIAAGAAIHLAVLAIQASG
jgi:uncharacterized membrane protein (DUF4010 family)